ncbi:hypothetical protein BS78_02G098500 [Paspalum vaginatum]|nr:hypothetical protein BS78_02G098500 [Paspalum vaginatum]
MFHRFYGRTSRPTCPPMAGGSLREIMVGRLRLLLVLTASGVRRWGTPLFVRGVAAARRLLASWEPRITGGSVAGGLPRLHRRPLPLSTSVSSPYYCLARERWRRRRSGRAGAAARERGRRLWSGQRKRGGSGGAFLEAGTREAGDEEPPSGGRWGTGKRYKLFK